MRDNLAYKLEVRKELIDGQLVAMSPRPVWNHVSAAGNIYNIFFQYLKGKSCTPVPDGLDLFLTEKDHFVPDMMVVCDPSKLQNDGVHGAPDLVVEVLSPSTAKNDRGYKKEVYSQCGVREYWIVDVANRMVEVYLPEGGQLTLHETYAIYPDFMLKGMDEEERAAVVTEFKCSLFDDLVIHLDDVFSRMI